MIEILTTGRIPSGTNSPSRGIDSVIEILTTGRMIPSGTNSQQQRYRPSDRNTDYWADDTLGD